MSWYDEHEDHIQQERMMEEAKDSQGMCRHHSCLCTRAAELNYQGRHLDALNIHRHDGRVRCRKEVRFD